MRVGKCLPQHIHTVVFIIWSRSPTFSVAAKRDITVKWAEKLKGTSKIVLASEAHAQQMMRVDQARVPPLN